MTLPRTAADVLSQHVTFELGCIDRMHLNVHVPGSNSRRAPSATCAACWGSPPAVIAPA
jgi:hypothetical protein